MGRIPLRGRSNNNNNESQKREAWTSHEDKILASYIRSHGEGKWKNIPKLTGLRRCGKSCRLRWMNYLRPDIKRGNITEDEEDLILRLHNLLGNRWSLIAGRLPGRTDNEIKNYWNSNLAKKRSKDVSKNGKMETAESRLSKEVLKPTESPASQEVLATSTPVRPRTEYCGDYDIATGDSVVFYGQSSAAAAAAELEEEVGVGVDGALMDFDLKDVDILEFLDFDFTGLEDFDMFMNMDKLKQEGRQSDSQSLSFSEDTNAEQGNQ